MGYSLEQGKGHNCYLPFVISMDFIEWVHGIKHRKALKAFAGDPKLVGIIHTEEDWKDWKS